MPVCLALSKCTRSTRATLVKISMSKCATHIERQQKTGCCCSLESCERQGWAQTGNPAAAVHGREAALKRWIGRLQLRPVAAIVPVKNEGEALSAANDSVIPVRQAARSRPARQRRSRLYCE